MNLIIGPSGAWYALGLEGLCVYIMINVFTKSVVADFAALNEKIVIGKNQFKKDKNPLTEESEYVCIHCYQTFIGDLDSY